MRTEFTANVNSQLQFLLGLFRNVASTIWNVYETHHVVPAEGIVSSVFIRGCCRPFSLPLNRDIGNLRATLLSAGRKWRPTFWPDSTSSPSSLLTVCWCSTPDFILLLDVPRFKKWRGSKQWTHPGKGLRAFHFVFCCTFSHFTALFQNGLIFFP